MYKLRIVLAVSGVVVPAVALAAAGSIPKSNLDALALLVAGVLALVLLRRRD
jgi:hypothetical protein